MDVNRRNDIINAFIKLCSRKGLDNTTMQDVAKEVGISVGTIYLEFRNKDELIEAFEKNLAQQFETGMTRIINQSMPAPQLLHDLLVGNIETMNRQIRENQAIKEFMMQDFVKHINKNIKVRRLEMESRWTEKIKLILKQGVEEGSFIIDDIPCTARMLFFAFGAFAGPIALEREYDEVIQDAESMFALLLRAIEPK
ncbi:MAG TPA: TetR/AcrR family transcriptional regulator [Firmicutes bacterium]|jgi:AcrR family transcriptional regulator|nr:TetR/AcrR family transcriptional regulator [Bacillota bacterium]